MSAWGARTVLALVLTPLGVFACPAIRCATAPPGLGGYFQAGRLLVTVEHRPFGLLACRFVADERDVAPVWACGPGEED